MRADGFLVDLGGQDVAGGFPSVGDGVGRAGDGLDKVAGIGKVAVGEGGIGLAAPSGFDLAGGIVAGVCDAGVRQGGAEAVAL